MLWPVGIRKARHEAATCGLALICFTELQPNNYPALNFNDNLKFNTSLSIKNHFNNKIFSQVHYYLITDFM